MTQLDKDDNQGLPPDVDVVEFIAPLAPLEPRYPLSLSLTNRQNLMSSEQLKRDQEIIARHQFPWLFLFVVLVGCLGWLFWKYIRPLYFPPLPIPIPPINIQNEAIKTLEKIKQQQLPQKGLYPEFFSSISYVVRRYLERQFHLPVVFQTTDEFLRYVETRSIFSNQLKQGLRRFFLQADQVKFAKHRPSLEECEQAYVEAQEIIRNENKIRTG